MEIQPRNNGKGDGGRLEGFDVINTLGDTRNWSGETNWNSSVPRNRFPKKWIYVDNYININLMVLSMRLLAGCLRLAWEYGNIYTDFGTLKWDPNFYHLSPQQKNRKFSSVILVYSLNFFGKRLSLSGVSDKGPFHGTPCALKWIKMLRCQRKKGWLPEKLSIKPNRTNIQ